MKGVVCAVRDADAGLEEGVDGHGVVYAFRGRGEGFRRGRVFEDDGDVDVVDFDGFDHAGAQAHGSELDGARAGEAREHFPRGCEGFEEFLAVPEAFAEGAFAVGGDFAGADDELAVAVGVEVRDGGVRVVEVDAADGDQDSGCVAGEDEFFYRDAVFAFEAANHVAWPGVDEV